jgi:DNA invertase Pin-like site-specific DNA recombinase
MFTIIGAMADLESSLISERVTAGMRAAEPEEAFGPSSHPAAQHP